MRKLAYIALAFLALLGFVFIRGCLRAVDRAKDPVPTLRFVSSVRTGPDLVVTVDVQSAATHILVCTLRAELRAADGSLVDTLSEPGVRIYPGATAARLTGRRRSDGVKSIALRAENCFRAS